jgi:uncharacterized protein YgiM (DUF1202 family)
MRPAQSPAPGVTIMPESSVPQAAQTGAEATLIAPDSCPGTPAIQLIVQERGQVVDDNESLNMRSTPGTTTPILTRIEAGDIFLVVGGPVCADRYTWFQVRYNGQMGWIAEGDLTEYYVVPYLPG